MEIKKVWDNIQFWTKIFFSQDGELKTGFINLLASGQNAIRKDSSDEFVIDYPWEYEKYNIYINAITWDTDRLNFFIFNNEDNTSFGFMQDSSVLEKLDMERYPEKWFYIDENVAKNIERLWFEWETEKID